MRASVVIPAHNEAQVIDRCLAPLISTDDVRIIVAANGCIDATAARARRHGVDVIEVERASKVAALNAGDAVAEGTFPRIYLDADIELHPDALDLIVEGLNSRADPVIASPRIEFDLTSSSVLVRSFYRVFAAMPYVADGIGGSGCYAVNSAGRQRWTEFPELFADDLFVQGLFEERERLLVETKCTTRAPRTLAALVRIRTRTYQGNRAAADAHLAGHLHKTAGSSAKALLGLIRRRQVAPTDAAVYVVINALARQRAKSRGADAPWLTDHTSRS